MKIKFKQLLRKKSVSIYFHVFLQKIRNAIGERRSLLYFCVQIETQNSPYVEKLMPMIKYLSEKMRFNDNLIKALCTFKEIPVKGKLYSTMFNQSFSADGAVCSLKEDKEGRFDLEIDGVSHHSWFRRKKDEFMEALGLPTSRRQNRGLKI